MKYRIAHFLFLLPAFFCILNVSGQSAPRNILTGAISQEKLALVLAGKSEFSPLPAIDDDFWLELDAETRQVLISNGEKYMDYDWPSLLARRYMDFDIDGNRTRFSNRYYARREAVAELCMAEIAENKGRFMDDIINGVWLILEETTWVVPAHSSGDKLHDRNDVFVDLFSAETAALLGWVDYYFGEKFDAVTPLIRERIYEEVNRRVIQSMLDHNDFWYMGYTGRIPNNWNPWIVSNWLTAVLLLEDDQERRAESTWKALDVLDQYLNPHPADGGCDEGPGYWGRAGASLFDCLFLLHQATDGALDVFDEPLIRNIGSYIYKIHIDADWFVNFADGSAINHHDPGTIFRIGRAISDRTMMAMAAEQFRHNYEPGNVPSGRSPFGQRIIPGLMIRDALAAFAGDFVPEINYFFPDLEVVVSRENRNNEGFFMAIKGGFNNESHNHNDVGNFVVFYDGLPVFIDAGVGTYTRKTFSNERYDIWTMQSAYHNLPTLNGEMQQDGDAFRAEDVDFTSSDRETTVSMDIADAYPGYAYTASWNRHLELDRRAGKITLTDEWAQIRQLERNEWHFMTAFEPDILRNGLIRVSNGATDLEMKFSRHFSTDIEKVEIDDPRLEGVWGNTLWRITLKTGRSGLKGKESFTISPE
ncbi:MAG: heparinase II/III family protein [Bacteroidales bacterium]|nr:heparinase II/III family protein [Bacteroidales bacterium]